MVKSPCLIKGSFSGMPEYVINDVVSAMSEHGNNLLRRVMSKNLFFLNCSCKNIGLRKGKN